MTSYMRKVPMNTAPSPNFESMTTQPVVEKTDPQSLRETLMFHEFPKIPRLNRDICITEKIDGTNAAIGITDYGLVYAQSRNRILGTGKHDDNMGFGRWVQQNAALL